jgi:hypothetical protein
VFSSQGEECVPVAKIDKSIGIDAPVGRVFTFMANLKARMEVQPQPTEVPGREFEIF